MLGSVIGRLQKLSEQHSCFLFGARGTGKTTLLKQLFGETKTLWIDLTYLSGGRSLSAAILTC